MEIPSPAGRGWPEGPGEGRRISRRVRRALRPGGQYPPAEPHAKRQRFWEGEAPAEPAHGPGSAGASPWPDEKLVLTGHFVAFRHHGFVAPSRGFLTRGAGIPARPNPDVGFWAGGNARPPGRNKSGMRVEVGQGQLFISPASPSPPSQIPSVTPAPLIRPTAAFPQAEKDDRRRPFVMAATDQRNKKRPARRPSARAGRW